jgi:asparagine synthase (glutamine-hydrolysing)
MCGISLLWDEQMPGPMRARLAQAMAESLRHRGPDGYGLWANAGAKLAITHRRLAIQGLGEQGAQPMVDPRGRYVLCYNGELFGALGLRAELIREGAVFRGGSDTEILLHALARWGVPETLSRIRGQFAFTWYDIVSQRLFLVRDRTGIRPLYYAASGRRLAVASEQKALLLLDWVDRSPRPEAMLRYLVLSRTDDVPGETLLAGVRSLPAGHWAEWDGSALRVHRYYRAEAEATPTTIEMVRDELSRAVAEQLVGDVPIGAMVSGGLDSSSVALLADRARAAANVSTRIHLFAYHDTLAEFDERLYQRAVLSSFTSPHEVHWITSSPAELGAAFERYIHHQEEPYGDVSSYAEYCIAAEAARQGVKVMLSGLGGDEVFAGYGAYLGPIMLDLVAERRFSAAVDLLRVAPSLGAVKGSQVALGAVYHALPARLRNALTAARASRAVRLSPSLALAASRDAYRAYHTHDGAPRTNSALRGSLESWSVPRYLAHSDRMGLAFGVEGRVPLLDEDVIRVAWGVPVAERLGKSGLKASLRAAADVLPPLVRDRAWKLGFHAPLRAYVAALEGQLEEGYRVSRAALGAAPPWGTLGFHARWLWGNLGAYLTWVARSPRATTRDVADGAAPVVAADGPIHVSGGA